VTFTSCVVYFYGSYGLGEIATVESCFRASISGPIRDRAVGSALMTVVRDIHSRAGEGAGATLCIIGGMWLEGKRQR
jgi:hypothetical protein